MILVLSDLWPPFPGGAERLAFNLARELMRRGERVHVLTGYEHAQAFDGPEVTIKPIGVFADHDLGVSYLQDALGLVRPDVILTHHLYAYEFADYLRATGIPIVQLVLNTRRIDGIAFAVYISKWVRDHWVDGDGGGTVQPDDMIITPPAFDDVVADTHGDHIGFIKPYPHKGAALFYEIAAQLPDRPFLVLRGEWQDLEVIEELPNVRFMEPVDDIRDFYRECRLVLMPSTNEDAGTVAQECALNDLVCISSNVEGLNETNGGLRLPPDDLAAWVNAIRLCDNPDVYTLLIAQQRAAFRATMQPQRLDEFARRIAALRSRR